MTNPIKILKNLIWQQWNFFRFLRNTKSKILHGRGASTVIIQDGRVQMVNGSVDFIVLNYDDAEKQKIKASQVFLDADIAAPRPGFIDGTLPGEQVYSAVTIPNEGAWLVVGHQRKGRFATFRGTNLGWKPGTRFPFDGKVEIYRPYYHY